MVEASFPAFLFAPAGVTWPGMRDMLKNLAQLKAETLVITDPNNREALVLTTDAISIPVGLDEIFTPIPYIIPAPLFAACLAEAKGLNPDAPRPITTVTTTL